MWVMWRSLGKMMNGEIQSKKILTRVREKIRTLHYSIKTEEAYISWIRRYILFHGVRHPGEMGEDEISAFLTHLAVKEHVSASTQNQALCALVFLYKNVLNIELSYGEIQSALY